MGNVYFLSNGKSIKIGYSNNIENRIKQLQTANEVDLRLIYYIEDSDEKFEKYVQKVCKAYHISGEWFDSEVINFLLNKSSPWFKENMKEK